MSPEQKAVWLSDRCGLLTASRMAEAMGKKGPAARHNLMMALVDERATGENAHNFVSDAMKNGLELEPEMFDVFVERYPQYQVRPSHFYTHPSILYFGATPDREIDDDGLLEGKCPTNRTFLEWRMDGVVPAEHMPQMAAQLLCTGRKWCGFIAYNPKMKDPNKHLFMRKYVPTPEYLAEVERAAQQFLLEVDAAFEVYVNS
jgi:predicted phage-related endonuclease